jgi:hypothetical protein
VVVQPVAPEVPEGVEAAVANASAAAAPVDHFRAFYEREHQRAPGAATLDLFAELYTSASAAD